jgi:hypothetical protein
LTNRVTRWVCEKTPKMWPIACFVNIST